MGPKKIPIKLIAPKSKILPLKSKTVKCMADESWFEVLTNKVQLKDGVQLTEDCFVCNTTYNPREPRPGSGWRGELTETVGQCMDKYRRKSKKKDGNTVRVVFPRKSPQENTPTTRYAAVKRPSRQGNNKRRGKNDRAPTKPQQCKRSMCSSAKANSKGNEDENGEAGEVEPKPIVLSSVDIDEEQEETGDEGQLTDQKVPVAVTNGNDTSGRGNGNKQVKIEAGESPMDQDDGEEDEDDNTSSLVVNEEGINVEDVKTALEGLVMRSGKDFLPRIKREIKQLKHANQWDMHAKRSPLGCNFLQEIFNA